MRPMLAMTNPRAVIASRRAGVRRAPARHRARPRAVAHDHADGDRQRLRVLDAQRGAGRAQRDLARAGARGRRWRDRAHGLRAVAAAHAGHVEAATGSRTPGRRTTSRSPRAPPTSPRRSTSTWRREPLLKGLFVTSAALDRTRRRTHRRCDPGLARPGRPEAPQRRRGSRLSGRRPQVGARQRAVRDGRRAGARAGRDGRALRARDADSLTVLFAPAGHQSGDRVARRAAGAAQCHAGGGRRLSSQQRADALDAKPAGPAVPAGARLSAPARCRVWRVRAEATLPDGVTFAREAVVQPFRRRRAAP